MSLDEKIEDFIEQLGANGSLSSRDIGKFLLEVKTELRRLRDISRALTGLTNVCREVAEIRAEVTMLKQTCPIR